MMEEHKSDLVNSPEQQTDELNCPSHHRKRWAIDKTVFDWHRRLPLHDRPSLRWALAVVLALIIIAVMIIGIVFSAEYYTAYYASGAWAWSRERVNSTQGSLSRMEALTKASQLLQATSDDANQMVQNGTLDETVNMSYRPGILHTAPCDPRWSCRHYDQPVGVVLSAIELTYSSTFLFSDLFICATDDKIIGHLLRARSVMPANRLRPEQFRNLLLQQFDLPGRRPPQPFGNMRSTSHAVQFGRRRRMLPLWYRLRHGWVSDPE